MATIEIERFPDTWLTKYDRTAIDALKSYTERMSELDREAHPRLRIEQYDRLMRFARMIDSKAEGLTFKGLRVLGGGMAS